MFTEGLIDTIFSFLNDFVVGLLLGPLLALFTGGDDPVFE